MLQGLFPRHIPWSVSSARGDRSGLRIALLHIMVAFKAVCVCGMLLPAHLAIWQLNCAEVGVLALGVGALPSVETQAQGFIAVLGCQVGHCCCMRR